MKSHFLIYLWAFSFIFLKQLAHAKEEVLDILAGFQIEMSHWPPDDRESSLAILESIKEFKNKIPENEFIFLFDSGFYSGLLDYSWGGEKRFNIDATILKEFQSELPLKKLPAFTRRLADGALKDLEQSINPNFLRGVKGAPLLVNEKEIKIQLVIPFLLQILTKQEDELAKSLRPAYQFSLYRSVLNLKTFASIHNIAVPKTLLQLRPNDNDTNVDESNKKETNIFHEIDLLIAPHAGQSKSDPKSDEEKLNWNPKD